MGDQEYDIVKSVSNMTKYATMIEDPKDIRYALEKAWHLATTGRPGPVWIDIPVNYQGGYIETDELRGYDPEEDDKLLPPPVDDSVVSYLTCPLIINIGIESSQPPTTPVSALVPPGPVVTHTAAILLSILA